MNKRDPSVIELLLLIFAIYPPEMTEMSVREFVRRLMCANAEHMMSAGRELVPGLQDAFEMVVRDMSSFESGEPEYLRFFSDSEIEAIADCYGIALDEL